MISRVVAFVALVALSPVLALLALAVLLEDGRPVLFRQKRIGRFGRPFVLLKFRSMYRDCGGLSVTAGNDPRITRTGHWLRRLKLDELPQLWNIVAGDMAFIGPRPEVPRFVDLADKAWAAVLAVRPGITDPATLVWRDEETVLSASDDPERSYRVEVLPQKLALSAEYLRRRSLLLDFKLIVLTIRYSFAPAGFSPDRVRRQLAG
jgi:lipopolysaccharide/colanic/teichoic acid biosynthesis glycosyltransferase